MRTKLAVLLPLCFLSASSAEETAPEYSKMDRQSAAAGKSGVDSIVMRRATAKSADGASGPAGNSEVFSEILLAAGKALSLDSTMDYSSASTVAVTVQCIICDSANSSLGTAGLVLQAAWSVPNAGSFVATENKAATAFLYWDAGGAVFNVYGPQFRLVLQNRGSQTIAIQQVTLFRRSPSSQ